MVEVFKTNVAEEGHAKYLMSMLGWHFPGGRISFDLEDCDKILRIERDCIPVDSIRVLLLQNGYECELLQ